MTARTSVADIPSLATSIVQWIAGNIIDGRWTPGERLNEVHIAEELGVSRAPVREALRTLGEQGLVTHVPRVGSVVNEFTPETVVHVYSLRAVIECWLVAESVRLMTDEVRAELPRIIDQMEAALASNDYPTFYGVTWRLREVLYSCHPNKIAMDEVKRLRERLHTLPNVLHSVPDMAEWTFEQHRKLVDTALDGKAEEAGQYMADMLLRTSELVKAAYESRLQSARQEHGSGQGATSGHHLSATL